MSILEVKKLTKSFKEKSVISFGLSSNEKKVLDQVDFSLSEGIMTGFLGANGSGKTTTLKCLLGLTSIDSGEVTFFNNCSLSPAVLGQLGFQPEQPYFYDYLTGEELLLFYGQLSTALKFSDLKIRARSLLKKLDLYEVKDRKIRTYSKGMLQKIGLAQALIHEPKFVILDEPMAGLDPDSRLSIGEWIRDLVKKGVTVFFSSHLLYDVEKLCQSLVILKEGKVAYSGSVQKLLNQMESRQRIVYLEKNQKHTVFVENLASCQNEIDRLRRRGCSIFDIQMEKTNLEQIFRDGFLF